MAGRPRKYTEERADKFLQAVRAGATLRLAAHSAGISEDTLARWRRDRADFAEQVSVAEASAAVGWLELINKAAETDWRAALKLLEIRFPGEYGGRTHITIDRDVEAEVRRVALEHGLSVDDVLAEAKAILREARQ